MATGYPAEHQFRTLLEQVRAGDEAAAWDLVETYGPHVIRTVRRNLSRELRGKFDSDDFAQAVWASFFAAPNLFTDVDQPAQLIGLLATMARNKVIDEIRRRIGTQKYSVRKERGLDSSTSSCRAASRDPTPSQLAIARERWIQMLQSQPETHRRVVRLKLMGRTNQSIAATLNISERTVQRVMERLTKSDMS